MSAHEIGATPSAHRRDCARIDEIAAIKRGNAASSSAQTR
jgi:hypothetical protein